MQWWLTEVFSELIDLFDLKIGWEAIGLGMEERWGYNLTQYIGASHKEYISSFGYKKKLLVR